jgi:hypothetical protein
VLTSGQKTTRWEEARERLLILFAVLAYVPVAGVRVQFLNRRDVIELSHAGHHPASFIKTASEQINRIFARPPSQGTPLFDNLNPIFTRAKQRPGRTAVYLFFDGEPSEGSGPTERLLLSRPAAKIPFTFVTVIFKKNRARRFSSVTVDPALRRLQRSAHGRADLTMPCTRGLG